MHRFRTQDLRPRPRAAWSVALGLALALTAAGAGMARADSRAERPVQLQADMLGLSVGYHFSRLIYLGGTYQFGVEWNQRDDQQDGDDPLYGQQGVDKDNVDLGARSAVELRISPWEFGLYFALGALHVQGDDESVRWDVRGRRVGRGDYITGLTAKIDGKPATVPALGIGFNHVFDFGLSLAVGALVGVQRAAATDVTVTAYGADREVAASDLKRFREKIEDRYFDHPVMLHLAAGYNF